VQREAGQKVGRRLGQRLSQTAFTLLIERSSKYVAFISETRAKAIYGNGAKILTAGQLSEEVLYARDVAMASPAICSAVTD